MGLNLVSATVIAAMFAFIKYEIKTAKLAPKFAGGNMADEEEDI